MQSGNRIGQEVDVVARLRGSHENSVVGRVVIEDLSAVLTHISHREGPNGPWGPMTQFLVAAGAHRLSDTLRGDLDPQTDADSPVPRLLSALVGHEPFVQELGLSVHHMRRRWPSAADWYADLLAYILRPGRHRQTIDETSARMAAHLELPLGLCVEATVREQLAYSQDPLVYRLSTAVERLWPEHPAVRRAQRADHEIVQEVWSALFGSFVEAYGLQLQPGASYEHGAWSIVVLITTEAHQRLIDPETPVPRLPGIDQPCFRSTLTILHYLAGSTLSADGRTLTVEEISQRRSVVGPPVTSSGADPGP